MYREGRLTQISEIMSNYNFSMAVLYTVCRLAWQNCLNNVAVFAARKGFYNAAFIAARMAEIDAAEALPDEQARDDAHETLRLQLKVKAASCREYWNYLERYIVSAYAKAERKPKTEAAGKDQYDLGGDSDWDMIALMMSNAYQFILDNSAVLAINLETGTPDNMPAGFPAEFLAVKNDFDATHLAFLQAEEGAQTGTQTKSDANDLIYEKMRVMLDDGVAYFKNNPAVKKQFVLTNLLELVGTPGEGGTEKAGTLNSGQSLNLFGESELNASSEFKADCTNGPGFWLYSANNAGDIYSGTGVYVTNANAGTFSWADLGGQKAFVNCYNPNANIISYEVKAV